MNSQVSNLTQEPTKTRASYFSTLLPQLSAKMYMITWYDCPTESVLVACEFPIQEVLVAFSPSLRLLQRKSPCVVFQSALNRLFFTKLLPSTDSFKTPGPDRRVPKKEKSLISEVKNGWKSSWRQCCRRHTWGLRLDKSSWKESPKL